MDSLNQENLVCRHLLTFSCLKAISDIGVGVDNDTSSINSEFPMILYKEDDDTKRLVYKTRGTSCAKLS